MMLSLWPQYIVPASSKRPWRAQGDSKASQSQAQEVSIFARLVLRP